MARDEPVEPLSSGSLTVVGTGIELGSHVTAQARAVIERADVVLHLVTDAAARAWIEDLNPTAVSLHEHYAVGVERTRAYEAMVAAILAPVRDGRRVCAAFYGHPGVFVAPSHEAVRRARNEGFEARVLPAVSAEDCLFADLGVDPAQSGCQSYESTDFLVHRRGVDPSAALVLWQVGVVGTHGHAQRASPAALGLLAERLATVYPPTYEAVLYVASPYPRGRPIVRRVSIESLPGTDVPQLATLFVPPAESREPDQELLRLLET